MKHIHLFILILTIPFFSDCSQSKKESELGFDISMVTFDIDTHPVVVLGGGIAGLTAASYLSQANIFCTVIEGEKPGGALAQSDSVRNWPGVINAPGADIVRAIKEQVTAQGVDIPKEKVISVDFDSWPFIVEVQHLQTKKKRKLKALSCIIAMGAEPNYLKIPGERGEDGYWGRGVTNCAVCDGSLYRGKNVAVVGGGDSAIVEASYLSGIANHVTIFVRKDYFRAKDKRKKEEVLSRSNVTVKFNTEVKQVIGDGKKVTRLDIENNKTGKKEKIAMDGLFLAIGAQPNTKLFEDYLDLDKSGYVMLKDEQETSQQGIFAAGDLCDPVWKQAVTSASGGCKAALQAQSFLDEIGFDAAKFGKKPEQKREAFKQKPNKRGVPSSDEKISKITSVDQFKRMVAQSSLPVIIDFYADLCIPCQNMAPILKKLADKFVDHVAFVKVNLSELGGQLDALLASIKGKEITTAPTFLMVKQGTEVDRLVDEIEMKVFEEKMVETFGL